MIKIQVKKGDVSSKTSTEPLCKLSNDNSEP